VTALVVFVYVPGAAPVGTCSVTSKVHEPSGGRLPPVNMRVLVPVNDEPAPQGGLGEGGSTAVRPASVALRLSVKEMLVAALFRSKLVIVKRNVVVPPGATGSSTNALFSVGRSTVRMALALPLLLDDDNPRSLLMLPSTPAPVAVTSTLTVQVAPAPTPGNVRSPKY
jgi:hypothetical protein